MFSYEMSRPSVAILVGIALFLTVPRCKSVPQRASIYGQNNAIWAQSIYFRGYNPSTKERLSPQIVQKFASILESHHIKYAYIFSGPFLNNGHLPDYAFSQTAIESVKLLKHSNPDLVILPWIGGVQNRSVHLQDTEWVNNALNDTQRLIDTLQVPGVHLDFEYILPGDTYLDLFVKKGTEKDRQHYGEYVNEFCRKIRILMPYIFISSVVVATSPGTKPWKRKTSIPELLDLTRYVNQLSFLYYDTKLNNENDFEENCEDLIKDIRFLYNKRPIKYLISVGTFINEPQLQKYRDLNIENLPNSFKVIKNKLLKVSPDHKIVDGISLYCDWQTTYSEWNDFDQYWRK
jgi:hypothetical protein